MNDLPHGMRPTAETPPSLLRRLAIWLRGDTYSRVRESLEQALEQSERENIELSGPERAMVARLLKFGEVKVSDVMVPRAEIVGVEESTPLDGVIAIFREAQHSRLPVYRETLDDPTGLVHIKDLLALVESGTDGTFAWRDAPISGIKRDLLFVPPSMPLPELLLRMQTTHIHLALVVDEYGGTDGLVSIEDAIEEIVGEIEDEHDRNELRLSRQENGSFIADARIGLEEFERETGIRLSIDGEEDIDSLGGLAVSAVGRVPQRGEIITLPSGYEFEILDADPRRVRRLRVRTPVNAPAMPAESKDAD
ncbi:MAG: HlyC/CorC family transporter [Alphaproteobacteria bacterium]|nr:HlyC/CorC family transporter [Alphaproteobacteria bacterium]